MFTQFLNEEILITDRLVLTVLNPAFCSSVLDYLQRNKEHFKMALPETDDYFFTLECQREAMWNEYELSLSKKAFRFYIFSKYDENFDRILGDVSVSGILNSPFHSCSLGYKLDKEETGNGIMTEAIKAVIEFLFNSLNLHKINVSILPENIDSVKLIENLEFTFERVIKDFLIIDGIWKDHLRYYLINS